MFLPPATSPIYFPKSLMWRWTLARDYCRALGMDLPTIHSRDQITTILTAVDQTSAWTGLFLDRWAWSDESPSSLRYWMTDRPATLQGCAVVSATGRGQWYEERCEVERPFVCQGGEFWGLHNGGPRTSPWFRNNWRKGCGVFS